MRTEHDDQEQDGPLVAPSVGAGTVQRLHALLGARFAASEPSLLSWSRSFRLEDDGPLDFSLFPFQREIYDAFGDNRLPTVDVRKSAQCGISAAAVSLALYAADAWGAHVLYVLPTEDMAALFSETRVRTAVASSPYLSSRLGTSNSKGHKRLGRANLYFAGAVAETKALSIPADVLCFDEYDRLDRANVPKFLQRLAAPTSMKLVRRFSNPSFPDSGIDECYHGTDQRSWLVRCPACRYEAPVAYASGDEDEHTVDEDRGVRACGRCHRPLPPEAVAAGRWVPRHPEITARGYHVSKLIVPTEDIGALVAEHRVSDEDSVTAHYNFSLGLAYAPRGGSLSRDQVLACRRDYACPQDYSGRDWVTAGVDVGRVLHVRISRWPAANDKAIPLFLGEAEGFSELAALWERYNVNSGLIDERPEERAAREFVRRFPGRARLARWSGQNQHDDVTVDDAQDLVIARRTWSLDQTVDAFNTQRRLLPRSLPHDYIRHLTAPHKVVEKTREGQKVARYVNDGRADHYFFAETYDLLAHHIRPVPAAGAWGEPPEPAFRGTVFPRW